MKVRADMGRQIPLGMGQRAVLASGRSCTLFARFAGLIALSLLAVLLTLHTRVARGQEQELPELTLPEAFQTTGGSAATWPATTYLEAELASVAASSAAADSASTAAADGSEYMNRDEYVSCDEIDARASQFAWQKNGFTIIPYGALWGSALYHTRRTFPEPYTLYVLPLNEEGEDDFIIDTRRTRLGIDVVGPSIAAWHNAATGGKVEIDFHGAFVVENKPGVLLRHAYGEIKNDEYRLLAGQTSDVISPLIPGALNYSVLWAQGNIGYRRAQVRAERYVALPADQLLTLQMSANQNIVSDFTGEPGVEPESVAWPLVEGRIAFTDNSPGPLAGPVELGVSGHIGEQGWDFTAPGPPPVNLPPADDVRIRTWSFNVDLRVPVTKRFGLQGEYFMGENLSTFLGGIVQGVCPCLREPIGSHGGWVELWYDWSPCYRSHVGFGLDNPDDDDLLFGRTYNHVLYSNLVHDVTEYLIIGVEVSLAKTSYKEDRPGEPLPISGESVGLEFMGQYVF